MLDRKVVEHFLNGGLNDLGIKVPRDIRKDDLVEAFCRYVEDDYYDWLRSNFTLFFQQDFKSRMNWNWIRRIISKSSVAS